MALHFTSVAFREEPDFLPTMNELETYKRKIEEHMPEDNKTPNKKNKKDKQQPYDHLFRKIKDTDEYDNLGRNISEQRWRQNQIPWTKVVYIKKFY
tara:strand:- start:2351 stop:2638 length:288 start_codon:yes stop_codon:yes gene_type:complete